jgi:hypothetical protein
MLTCPAYSSTLKMEAVHSSEALVNIYQTTWQHIPEDSLFHVNLVSHKYDLVAAGTKRRIKWSKINIVTSGYTVLTNQIEFPENIISFAGWVYLYISCMPGKWKHRQMQNQCISSLPVVNETWSEKNVHTVKKINICPSKACSHNTLLIGKRCMSVNQTQFSCRWAYPYNVSTFELQFNSAYQVLCFQNNQFWKICWLCIFVWWWFSVKMNSLDTISYITTSVPNLAICHPATKRANMATCSGWYHWTWKD